MTPNALRFLIATLLCAGTSQAIAQTSQMSRIRGVIDHVDGSSVVVKTREGDMVTVKLTDKFSVAAVVKASLDDIKPGAFIGTAAMPQGEDGSRIALEVVIFPEAMRGTGEGDRPWDLKPKSSMTNATVTEASVAGVNGKVMTLTYKGGQRKVTVEPDTPIVTYAPGTAAEMQPGIPVFLLAEQLPDGALQAGRITVGRDGVAPPM